MIVRTPQPNKHRAVNWEAKWISVPWTEDPSNPGPAPILRRAFASGGATVSARLHVTCLGLYDVRVNGRAVTDAIFTPGWTSYQHRLQYQTYDVTDLLRSGRNAIAARLGDGWYRGFLRWDMKRSLYGDRLALLAQLEIRLDDGSTQIVSTDATWRAASGPIRSSDIYLGEVYDARLEMPGWDLGEFNDDSWERAVVVDGPGEILVASEGPAVRRIQEIRPVAIESRADGSQVVDMGQNMVGRCRIRVSGPEGAEVVLRHAEVLNPDGSLYRDNLRQADQEDRYILAGRSAFGLDSVTGEVDPGSGIEIYEPVFTFHGFRYVEVTGYPRELVPGDVTGIVIHSDMEVTGSFETSNPLLNQLQHNIVWGLKGNFLDIPTDCPQRDERLGWTGDAQVFARTAAFNMDVQAFFGKWLADVAADQHASGSVPWVVPDVLSGEPMGDSGQRFGHGATGWGDAAVVIPWTLYELYGDSEILERQYESMRGWVEYMRGRARDGLIWEGDTHFGDWLAYAPATPAYPGATTSTDLIATAYFARSADLLSRSAKVLGRQDNAARYADLFRDIRAAFGTEFVTAGGRLVSETQTAYTLALAFGLAPDGMVETFVDRLAADVERRGHLTTGFLGASELSHVLSDYGHLDLAYKLLLREEYPSWLYPVTQGATTIWERWDGQKPDGSFQDPGMNSFNHYAYGAIGDWMYRVIGGINPDPDEPGYEHVIIHPRPGGGLTFARASLKTARGMIRSEWEIDRARMTLEVEIPVDSRATVTLPGEEASGGNAVGPGVHRFEADISGWQGE